MIQLLATNVIFVLVGMNILKYSNFTINLYVSSCIVEIITLVTIIVNYLFSDKNKSMDNMVKDYVSKDQNINNYPLG